MIADNHLKVVFVDDDEEILNFLKLAVRREAPHFKAVCLGSPEECLEYVRTAETDCIVSDYQMPGMNGMELLRAIRKGGSNVPFIFLTGQGSEAVARDAFKGGAYDYFTKELSSFAYMARFVNSIEKAVRHRKWTEDLLRMAAEGVSRGTGQEFFDSLVRFLARSLDMDFAFAGRLSGEKAGVIDTVSVYAQGDIVSNFSYELAKTPCEDVFDRRVCVFPSEIQKAFPEDRMLADIGMESYAGAPLFDTAGNPIGLMAVLSGKPMEDTEKIESLLTLFAPRAALEIERMREGLRLIPS